MALRSFFQKVVKIKNEKKFSIKKLPLPLTSGVKLFFGYTIFDFWIICHQIFHNLYYREVENAQTRQFNMEWKKQNKVCIGHEDYKRQCLRPKKGMDYFWFFFHANLFDLEYFEYRYQKLTYGVYFLLNFHHWI